MIMQQKKNDNDDKKNVSLIEYKNIIMINEYKVNEHKINNHKNIVIIEYKNIRYENV